MIIRRRRLSSGHYSLALHSSNQVTPSERVRDSAHAYRLLLPSFLRHMDISESCRLLALDAKCGVLGIHTHSQGGSCGTTLDHRLLFSVLLLSGAAKWILSHNHPGGSSSPSAEDYFITARLMQASQHLGLQLCDHIILARDGYYSFREHGKLP